MSAVEVGDEIRQVLQAIRAAPRARFDRLVVRDLSLFDNVPRRSALTEPMLGVPVLTDATIEAGVIELRLGDDLVERVKVAA